MIDLPNSGTEQVVTTNTTNYIQVINTAFYSLNDCVACKPPEALGGQKINGSSVASLMSQIENLRPLEVLYPDDMGKFAFGDKVYLRRDAYDAPFLKAVYYINNMPFILVPKNIIVLKEAAIPWMAPQVNVTSYPVLQPQFPDPHNQSYTVIFKK